MRKTIILMAIVGSLLGAILVGAMSAANSAPINYCHSGSQTLTASSGSKGACCPSGNPSGKKGTNGGCCATVSNGDGRGKHKPATGCCVSVSKGHHHDKDHDGDDHGKSHSDPDDAGCSSD